MLTRDNHPPPNGRPNETSHKKNTDKELITAIHSDRNLLGLHTNCWLGIIMWEEEKKGEQKASKQNSIDGGGDERGEGAARESLCPHVQSKVPATPPHHGTTTSPSCGQLALRPTVWPCASFADSTFFPFPALLYNSENNEEKKRI